MSVSLAACVRVTAKHSAVWRTCAGCGSLAPLAPDETRCRGCGTSAALARVEARRSRRSRTTSADRAAPPTPSTSKDTR